MSVIIFIIDVNFRQHH